MNDTIANLAMNQIPGNTPLTPDELKQLKPSLTLKSELNEWELKNILEANRWALSSRVLLRRDPLTEPYLRELHKRMFDQTWKWAGKYRTTVKINLGVPFHEIHDKIRILLDDARYWIEHQTFDWDEAAIRFHHRLVCIHPFPNGNGRHARLLADVIAVKNGREQFTWGSTTLAAGPGRAEYIRCLQAADANNDDIQGLLHFARS
jgi:Fic-DOC domain mobile mystery protein B